MVPKSPTPGHCSPNHQNAEVVSQIKGVIPGHVMVDINDVSCPGRADIRILYATASDRQSIRAILGDGKYFFGVPYQMHNT